MRGPLENDVVHSGANSQPGLKAAMMHVMLRSLPRLILMLWIAAGCPALCALRASSEIQSGSDGCCDHRLRGEPADSDPTHPPVPACNPCLFSAGHVVVPEKPIVVELLMPALLTRSGFFTFSNAPVARGPLAAFVSPSPPESERTLPLLI